MARKLSEKQEAEIIMKLTDGATQTSLANEYGVDRKTISNIKNRHPEYTQKVAQKKEENVKSILDFMDSIKGDVCELLSMMLEYMSDKEKLEKASLNQIATAFGIVVDKFTATEQAAPKDNGENNLLEAIAGCVREDDFIDDVSDIQPTTEESGNVVEE